MYRHSWLVLAVLLIGPLAQARRPGATAPRQGVWVGQKGQIAKISPKTFAKRFGLQWTRRQVLGRGVTESSLPGYSDGPGSFNWEDPDAKPWVAPQYRPSPAERRALDGRTAPLYVARVSKSVGHGLFARGTIRKGTIIGEYTGAVRQENREADRLNAYTFVYDPFGHFPLLVDAKEQGNYLRFANHSSKNANASSKLVYDAGHRRWHVLLVASQQIRRGDQVLFDYGQGYDWSRFGIQQPAELKPR